MHTKQRTLPHISLSLELEPLASSVILWLSDLYYCYYYYCFLALFENCALPIYPFSVFSSLLFSFLYHRVLLHFHKLNPQTPQISLIICFFWVFSSSGSFLQLALVNFMQYLPISTSSCYIDYFNFWIQQHNLTASDFLPLLGVEMRKLFIVMFFVCLGSWRSYAQDSGEAPMEKTEMDSLFSAIQGFVGNWWNGSDLYPDPCGWTPIQVTLSFKLLYSFSFYYCFEISQLRKHLRK